MRHVENQGDDPLMATTPDGDRTRPPRADPDQSERPHQSERLQQSERAAEFGRPGGLEPPGGLATQPPVRSDDPVTDPHGLPATSPADVRPAGPGELRGGASRPGSAVVRRTRISGTWVAIVVAIFVLIFLLVFILQNLTNVTVAFLGLEGTLPLGVALLFAAIAGALLVALVGAARILQLRRRVRRFGASNGPTG
jgi:uncharacterized integral membrane protein